MIKIHQILKSLVVIILLLCLSISSAVTNAENKYTGFLEDYEYSYDQLDQELIYNLTKALSNIIFTEYNESAGEIAKGRAYGTKGEHKAAEILYENLSALGLYTYKEQITNTELFPKLTHELEIKSRSFKINGREIESYIAPVWFETVENFYDVNYTYNYTNISVIEPPLFPDIYAKYTRLIDENKSFVILMEDRNFCPYNPIRNIPFLDNFYFNYYIVRRLQGGLPLFYSRLWEKHNDLCKGIVFYDFNEDTYDMNVLKEHTKMPFIFINRSNGLYLKNNLETAKISFSLEQEMNTSVISHNIIAQINGTDPSKTIIVDSLYDSWWCQGTADSAIGTSIVVACAKYFVEHNITPKYTVKFICFSGEEHGFCAGAKHYASSHLDEDIVYMIDLNQIGFLQEDPVLRLNIMGNKIKLLSKIKQVLKDADYGNRVDSSTGLKYVWLKKSVVSNPQPFIESHPDCANLVFLKDSGWKLHHRDGVNHTKGDTIDYYDPEDVQVTSEMVLNTVKYLTI